MCRNTAIPPFSRNPNPERQNAMKNNNNNAPRLLRREIYTSEILQNPDAHDPRCRAIQARLVGKDFFKTAIAWTFAQGHPLRTEDNEKALLLTAFPFTENKDGDAETRLELWAVSRGQTYEHLRGHIGAMIDRVDIGRGCDMWIADAFWDVSGVNPAGTALFLNAGRERLIAGAAVFAGHNADGETTSIPDLALVGVIAEQWTRASLAAIVECMTMGDEDAAKLTANGGELMEMEETRTEERDGIFQIISGAHTPKGAPQTIQDAIRNNGEKKEGGAAK